MPVLPAGSEKSGSAGKMLPGGKGTSDVIPAEGAPATVIPADNLKRNQMMPPAAKEETAAPAGPPPASAGAAGSWSVFYLAVFLVLAVSVFFVWRKAGKTAEADQKASAQKAPAAKKRDGQTPPPSRQVVDYSAETTREVVDLISAPLDLAQTPQLQRKNEFKPDNTGNFEIRVQIRGF